MPVEIKVRNFFNSRVGVQKKSRTPHLTKSFFLPASPPDPSCPSAPLGSHHSVTVPLLSGGGRLRSVTRNCDFGAIWRFWGKNLLIKMQSSSK